MRRFGTNSKIESKAKQLAQVLSVLVLAAIALLLLIAVQFRVPAVAADSMCASLGFDRNEYPGDAAMKLLRHDFDFAGYWLTSPPGGKSNTWKGKRELLRSLGYGFLLLAQAPDSSQLKTPDAATEEGAVDAHNAATFAKSEGFSSNAVIFLDIEEGGRLPETYHAYLRAWSNALGKAGFRPGVYCSGMPVKEERGVSIATTDDIHNDAATSHFIFWVYNDACPPSPGCAFPQNPPSMTRSGTPYAFVWQFAQSPRRREFTSRCARTYHRDGNCYAPSDTAHEWFLDVNSATSADPSGGAK